jgi:hypothetical protein
VADALREVVLRFAWSPSSGRVKATYRAEVIGHIVESERYLCRLAELTGVERRGAGDAVSDGDLHDLVGKHVRVPGEALDGLVLPLKMSTLTETRTHPYFFDAPA